MTTPATPSVIKTPLKVGLYIDAANIAMNGGFGMRFSVLRDFACRDGAEPIRLNAYVSFDPERANIDREYARRQDRFYAALREQGYKLIQKNVKWYTDPDTGEKHPKANVDLDLAVDALLQSERLDRVVLATGDGDFVQVVRALQNHGCRVEAIAFDNVSTDLRREVDLYISGYLIPDLLPIQRAPTDVPPWGKTGSFVRGVCYNHDLSKKYGFVRYLTRIDGEMWRTDSRDKLSPYASTFCHESEYPDDINTAKLMNRNLIVEFQIISGTEEGKTQATSVRCFRAVT